MTQTIGIIREEKTPRDKRAPFSPEQCRNLINQHSGLKTLVQPSPLRCFTDMEYADSGAVVQEDLSSCDMLMGIKEVPSEKLIPGKKYLFFSHTIKGQPHNMGLLRAILEKKVTLIDYECLRNRQEERLVGFGRYAGIAGAYNGLRAAAIRRSRLDLQPTEKFTGAAEMFCLLKNISMPPLKIVITGTGRVAGGAVEVMEKAGIKKISPEEFLSGSHNFPVYCQLGVCDYNRLRNGKKGNDERHFFRHPEQYESAFLPYTRTGDLLIACHYWDPKAPCLFEKKDIQDPSFRISIIADISCDLNGSVPTTVNTSTIEIPFYGYDKKTGDTVAPFDKNRITVMAIDNLPNSLPRDSSEDFGRQLCDLVFPHLFSGDRERIIHDATITENGKLTDSFRYLEKFL